MNKGVLYVASNKTFYLEEAVFSAKSFKKYNKNIPITIYTNLKEADNYKVFDQVIFDYEDLHPFLYKTKALNSFPYQKTLFVDSDTMFKGSVYELFPLLDNFDLAIAKRIHADWNPPIKFIKYEDPFQFNTGVFSYNDSQNTRDFFKKWLEEVIRENELHNYYHLTGDQVCFNHLLIHNEMDKHCNMKIVTIPNRIYNARHMFGELKKDNLLNEVKIWHQHGLNKSIFNKIKDKLFYKFK
ncbi:putative nucleotide-diphospho-sugar transferase [Formosa sp. L2A11]|uniref:putative nucleotide-diphospho-sugar transferase n=1 Tax=Formosa sp. L2A11 TaxID=2686363 RepID=UPI00131AFFE1|nr:putative nucleotide-diphospho-sugar transferase [Formosa sp. L2A11]